MADNDLLQPPRQFNQHYEVPLSPLARPPFAHYHSTTSTLPATPRTPYPPPSTLSLSPPRAPQTRLTPYLTLPPRLLLVTLTPPLLPLLMTISHLFATRSSTDALASQLKKSILSACSGLATGAASLQTLPRYLAMQTNEEMIKATQASILAIGDGLMDVITIVEVVLEFMVDTYRSFLMCTIQLAVQGTLDILISAVQIISSGVTSSLNAIRSNIQNDISAANSVLQAAVAGVNKVTALVDVTVTIPNMTIPSLNGLSNVTVPTTFETALLKLNSSLPSLNELRTTINTIIDTPFEMLKREINETRLEMAASFNSSILPTPSLSSLSANNANDLQNQLCSGLDTSLVDDTANALHKLASVSIGLMFLALMLIWIGLCIWEWRKWKALKDVVESLEGEWRQDEREGREKDAWRAVAIVEHPILERYGSRVLDRVARRPETRTTIRWYLSYLSHPTCLALLLISLFGIITLQFQLLALSAIKTHASESANSTVTASTNSLTRTLNEAAANSSLQYAIEMNAAISKFEARMQEELFGTWLNTTAVVLNQTLVEFYADVENVLNITFGSTILYNPVNTFMYCILGSKITTLEKGLTWLSAHSQITLPKISNTSLILSNQSMNELVSPITAAAVGSSSSEDDDGGLVGSLIDHFEKALLAERNFYSIILGVWVGFALVGLIVVLWNSGARERYNSWRGISENDHGHNTPKRSWPWTKPLPIFDEYTEKHGKVVSVPTIIEPANKDSFFDYRRDSSTPTRPFVPRKGTFVSTLSALAAPGQAFLRMGKNGDQDEQGRTSLVDDGVTSEKYTNDRNEDLGRPETPPPFWVDRFYGVVGGVKSLWPSRGLKHGQAMNLKRTASQKTVATENSFGASRMATAVTPRDDWRGDDTHYPSPYPYPPVQATSHGSGSRLDPQRAEDGDDMIRKQQWTLVDQDSLPGQSLRDGESRYPPLHPSLNNNRTYNPGSHSVYPRPMSRASTIYDNPNSRSFGESLRGPTPPGKHDSIDYLIDQGSDSDNPFDNDRDDLHREEGRSEVNYPSYYANLGHGHRGGNLALGGREGVLSPASSNVSCFAAEPHLESVSRVQSGTAALAAVIKNLEQRRIQDQRFAGEREGSPFGDERAER